MFQDKEKISNHQSLMLILAGALGTIFVVMAVPAIKDAGRDAWISVLLAYGIGTLMGLVIIKLGLRFPNKTIIQYLPKIFGSFLGKLVGLIYILSFLLFTAIVYREEAEVMAFFLEETPPIAIIILDSLLIVYLMKKGFKVFARTLELIVPVVIFLIILLLLLISFNLEWKNLTPILEEGFLPVLKGIPLQLGFAMEGSLFMGLWLPCLIKKNKGIKNVLIGIPLIGILLTILVVVTIAFTGTELTVKQTIPIFYMSRYIFIANFLTGFETIFIILWLAAHYFSLLMFFYPTVVGLAQWLNLKDYKSLVLPLTAISVTLAIAPSNAMDILKLDNLNNLYVVLPLSLLILIAWLIAVVRKLDES